MSRVVLLKTKQNRESVLKNIKKAMELGEWKKYIKGKKIIVKVNCVSDQLVPSQNTSPWVLEGVLKVLTENLDSDIILADANTNTALVNRGKRIWGYDKLCDKYGIQFRNLTEEKMMMTNLGGNVLQKMPMPETMLNYDSLITVPIIKTHGITRVTCSMKNQWGCIPMFRHQYHPVVHEAIVDVNMFLKPSFTVIDGTICMEGAGGPRNGKPKICDTIMASNDLVAADATVCRFMGYNPEKIGHVKRGHERGLGNMEDVEIVGNKLVSQNFEPPTPNIVLKNEMFFRKTIFKKIMFNTPVFDLLCQLAFIYNSIYWYNFFGKKYRKEILKTGYGDQFKR